ncbi:hypothetical protein LPB140_05680 [Sphingorhabdus lutea]|uniref:Enoyl-CoA hydratase n=1 Tax=Sphingorhabdus lutea TaxID=1913578 RepID=A0A1L3JB61_9SPHN|nr:crotonase/enoyl-CoA hydratase family protein [Sphingorhabdus lutea]APG62370.1 hypothetical protein LPB140_05680 [Sphingorhabdus lutea]
MNVTTKIENDIALITMDDGKANVVNFEMMDALHAALDEAEAKAKAIVITGREGRFSGGFDLKFLASADLEGARKLLDEAAKLLMRIYGGPLPSVAACNGHAIATGCFLLLSCDTRIGTKGDFKLGANETVNNMTMPVFALELLRARIHSNYQTRAIVQSEIYNPEGAVKAGYLDMVADADAVLPQAMAIAGQLAMLPKGAYAYNKRALRQNTIDIINASIGIQPNLASQ